MQGWHLKVEKFRGTVALDWTPGAELCCVIGPGDARRTTALDAIEVALSAVAACDKKSV